MLLLILLSAVVISSTAEVIDFGDIALVSEDAIPAAYEDIQNTGSDLFQVTNDLEKNDQISLNIKIGDLMSNNTPYFRTHPKFVTCLKKIISHVHNTEPNLKVTIMSGFKVHEEGNNIIQDLYAASGTGVVLTVTQTDTNQIGDLFILAESALMFCPKIFAEERQYLGIIMQASSMHIHMTGSVDSRQHYFDVDGNSERTQSEFNDWAVEKLNNALNPITMPRCTTFSELANGESYPEMINGAEDAVGAADTNITNEENYLTRLVIYPGTVADIEYDTTPFLMSPRMYEVIRKLQYYVRRKISDKLNIVKLFAPEEGSLHLEGRQANIKLLNDNSEANLLQLSQLAKCAGADFVFNHGDFIAIAVKKQKSLEVHKTEFQQGDLISVNPAEPQLTNLMFSQLDEYPVYDGEFQENKYLSELTQVGHYMSSSTRYFRVDPAIVQCYDKILRYEKKWNNGELVNIPVQTAFKTAQEVLDQYDPNQDTRGNAFVRGQAIVLKYDDSLDSDKYTIHRLVHVAILNCGPVFNKADSSSASIGIGIYEDGIYIDMREDYLLWLSESVVLPNGVSQANYYDDMEELYENAIKGYAINPQDPNKACLTDEIPQRQSFDYEYSHPHHIQQRRRRRSLGEDQENCVVQRDTTFCRISQQHRNNEIAHLWTQIKRKHMVSEAFEFELHKALKGCFGTCGTCLIGEVYEDKQEHCNNLLHRVNFNTMNEKSGVTNFYFLHNMETRQKACEGLGDNGLQKQCLSLSPLYAIFASSVYALFRPDPNKSPQEELYGAADNPSAVPEILYQIYSITANGTVTVWVSNEEEIKFLNKPLKVAMVYNKAVTHVKIMVMNEGAREQVGLVLETMITSWVSSSCPLHSRKYVAPYSLHNVPSELVRKRDTRNLEEFSFGERKLLERKHFERLWINKMMR